MRRSLGASSIAGCLLCALLLGLMGVAPTQAARAPLSAKLLKTNEETDFPKPEGQIEGACGLAASGSIYVSDYRHRSIVAFSGSGEYQSQLDVSAVATKPEGPCGLAIGPGGALYANIWHERVVRLEPTVQVFDTNESAGVAVDEAGNVYVNDRTYVAVYQPSGAPVLDGGEPLRIGLGSLGDGFGVAVIAGRVFVPDAADNTVKAYDPAIDPLNPAFTIDSTTPGGKFISLVDASVAVDPTNEHLLVVDNLKPGYKHPEAAIYEFDFSGAFLGQLPKQKVPGEPPSAPARGPVHGEPSGIDVRSDGTVYVTDGNGEKSNAFAYGPYVPGGGSEPVAPPGEEGLPQAPLVAPGTGAAIGSVAAAVAPSLSSRPRRNRRPRRAVRRPRVRAAIWGAQALAR